MAEVPAVAARGVTDAVDDLGLRAVIQHAEAPQLALVAQRGAAGAIPVALAAAHREQALEGRMGDVWPLEHAACIATVLGDGVGLGAAGGKGLVGGGSGRGQRNRSGES